MRSGTLYLIMVIYFCNIGNQCVAKIINCGPGFYLATNMTCIDDNECGEVKATASTLCGANTECYNTFGSFYCTCKAGYFNHAGKTNFTSRTNCHENNECFQNPPVCGPNTIRYNIVGSFYCLCQKGFITSSGLTNFTDDNTGCIDINECLTNPCGPNLTYTNVPGDYYCTCKEGFVFINQTKLQCQDVDECLNAEEACGPNASCNNTAGGFYCTCNGGFVSTTGEPAFTNKVKTQCQDLSFNCPPNFRNKNHSAGELCGSNQLVSEEQIAFCSVIKPTILLSSEICEESNGSLSKNFISSASDIVGNDSLWNGLEKNKRLGFASELLEMVEVAALTEARQSHKGPVTKLTTPNIDIDIRRIGVEDPPVSDRLRLQAGINTMSIFWRTVTGGYQSGTAALAFISYNNMGAILNEELVDEEKEESGEKSTTFQLVSKVVSATIGKKKGQTLLESINITFKHTKEYDRAAEPVCTYWKNTAEASYWSPKGCNLQDSNQTHTTCTCYHLSSFAILVAQFDVKVWTHSHRILSIITYMGIIPSLMCLGLTIITFTFSPELRSPTSNIHTNLCLTLFLAELLFLIGFNRTSNKILCGIIAGSLHYLFLAAFTWTCLEGVQLYLLVRNMKKVKASHLHYIRRRYMYPCGYGVAALILVIAVSINPQGYGSSTHCWLKTEDGFLWSFLGPVALIVMINMILFLTILWILRDQLQNLNPEVSKIKDMRMLTFKAIAQVFILGIPWIFGMFYFREEAVVMAYLFTIVNSFQGIFIFIILCVLNRQVREEYRKRFATVCGSMKKPSLLESTSTSVPMSVMTTVNTLTESGAK
ncbi:adhesion G protein-coupled receptor E3-like isoform X2 [Heterodontus francisci]|uniref:adhesion G protein-coupled receptor E3-like isoform X2 n=1 Tax=Heterodontus francisci TaxID=7792 RepID=UPI00355C7F55